MSSFQKWTEKKQPDFTFGYAVTQQKGSNPRSVALSLSSFSRPNPVWLLLRLRWEILAPVYYPIRPKDFIRTPAEESLSDEGAQLSWIVGC